LRLCPAPCDDVVLSCLVGHLYTAIHLLAYFASSLPNINTLKLYFFLPLSLFCRVDVVKFGADACLCVPMRVDACRCGWCGN